MVVEPIAEKDAEAARELIVLYLVPGPGAGADSVGPVQDPVPEIEPRGVKEQAAYTKATEVGRVEAAGAGGRAFF